MSTLAIIERVCPECGQTRIVDIREITSVDFVRPRRSADEDIVDFLEKKFGVQEIRMIGGELQGWVKSFLKKRTVHTFDVCALCLYESAKDLLGEAT